MMIYTQPPLRVERRRMPATNQVLTFIAHRCQCASHFGVSYRSLRAAYLAWCKDYDLAPALNDHFCESLAALGFRERKGGLSWDGLRLIEH